MHPEAGERLEYDEAWVEGYPSMPYRHPDEIWPVEVGPHGPFENVLDVGGGNGVVARGWWDAQGAEVHVLDAFAPETMMANFRLTDAESVYNIYGSRSFDVVQMTEVLEHMTKAKGRQVVALLKLVARKLVIVTTPCGFLCQDVMVRGNPHQVHVSGWSPMELHAMGFCVSINGPERAKQWQRIEKQYDRPQMIGWLKP